AAEVVRKRLLNRRLSRSLGFGEESCRLHDHAVDAVAALRRLLFDESPLHWMQLLDGAQAFQCHDRIVGGQPRQRCDARARRRSVDMNGAGAALSKPATETRSTKTEIIPQRVKQGHVGVVDGKGHALAIDAERLGQGHCLLLWLRYFYSDSAPFRCA